LRPVFLSLPDPLEGHGVILRDIASFHEDRLAMLQVDPMVGHRSSTERCPQTGDGRAVSKTSLMLDVDGAEQACGFLKEVTFLVGVLRASHERKTIRAIYRNIFISEFFGGNPGRVSSLLNLLRDSVYCLFPSDFFPVITSWSAVLGSLKAIRRGVGGEHRHTFGAKRAAVHDVVVVAFYGDQFAVANGGNHSAATGTEVARGGELCHVGKLEVFGGGPDLVDVDKPVEGQSGSGTHCEFQPISAGNC